MNNQECTIMRKMIFTLLLVAGSLSLQAQEKWVSVTEMRQAFFDNYLKRETGTRGYQQVIALGGIDQQRMVGNALGRKDYVIGCLDKDKKADGANIVQLLQGEAFTGLFDELEYPLNYMGNGVSACRRMVWRASGTEMQSQTKNFKRPQSLGIQYGENRLGYSISSKGELETFVHLDGPSPLWTDKLGLEMKGLTDMVNARWSREVEIPANDYTFFSVLLYVQKDGKVDMELLLPKKLSPNEEKEAAILRRIVKQLPQWAISYWWRTDGQVFPGRYMKFLRLPHGTWLVTDYMQDVVYVAQQDGYLKDPKVVIPR